MVAEIVIHLLPRDQVAQGCDVAHTCAQGESGGGGWENPSSPSAITPPEGDRAPVVPAHPWPPAVPAPAESHPGRARCSWPAAGRRSPAGWPSSPSWAPVALGSCSGGSWPRSGTAGEKQRTGPVNRVGAKGRQVGEGPHESPTCLI